MLYFVQARSDHNWPWKSVAVYDSLAEAVEYILSAEAQVGEVFRIEAAVA
jgi:hypothetical protein